ncbi:hypothetical protein BH09ACT7_BH09ACT7_29050 [soil metagenome]
MSDDGSGGLQVRQSPRKRTGDARVADFTTMVRVPGRPAATRVYTDTERQEAARYAAEVGGEVVALPLPPPAGYEMGLDGSLVPLAPNGQHHVSEVSCPGESAQ